MKNGLSRIIMILFACVFPLAKLGAETGFYRITTPTTSSVNVVEITGIPFLVWTEEHHVLGQTNRVEFAFDIDGRWIGLTNRIINGTVQGVPFMHYRPPLPEDMVLVGTQPFLMGDSLDEGSIDERPVRWVSTLPVFVAITPVTTDQMRDTLQWAFDQGHVEVNSTGAWNIGGSPRKLVDLTFPSSTLVFSNDLFAVRDGFAAKPVIDITWYGALAYTHYRNLIENLPSGIDLTNWTTRLLAGGYRLPTEAEWENAARGIGSPDRFPWPSTSTNLVEDINGNLANYWNSGDAHESANHLYLAPVGDIGPTNSIGLRDFSGNVYEWCLDWYAYGHYTNNIYPTARPEGPTNGIQRVIRGGSWADTPDLLRVSHRIGLHPHAALPTVGFRVVRGF
ncbi:MAG TPA: SUMF1/EgtB/PvdO family nonheme iron enzyme [Kiritimatiellia bacterium]|nr:SUMF1/EgtB/PvdO family nonheme iron enzyme [Kiritimatiellia bacterium]